MDQLTAVLYRNCNGDHLMKDRKGKGLIINKSLKRCNPDISTGLTAEQVRNRIDAGAVNIQRTGLTPTISSIISKNIFTLFNFINVFLAVILVIVGHPENILFLGIAISNTCMGIFQELRAKRGLDKLSVLAKAHVTVIRDGAEYTVAQDEIVLDDIVILAIGNQVCADAVVVSSERLEVDESLLTGETDRIQKSKGDTLLSGSYVTSGHGYAQITAIGENSYAHSLTVEAKKSKKQVPPLLRTLNRIILILTIVILPLGTTLFYMKYFLLGDSLETAVLGSSASVLGMIPAGLILLTGVTMTVGALKLAKRKALVQELYSIETLARTDVLCLDKTGTITDGSLQFERLEPYSDVSEKEAGLAVSELMGTLEDKNATAAALTKAFGKTENWVSDIILPFSSERKWSGATFKEKGSYIIGAPNIVFKGSNQDFLEQANAKAALGFRVLCLAHSPLSIAEEKLPEDLSCHALLILSDHLRENANETFRYFSQEGVILKVISGDNPRTVQAVAEKAGISGSEKSIDMSQVEGEADYTAIVEEYTIFGHVTPQQKRELIRGLKKNGHTACMTGDGVNDILAMREADCSVAMVGGSDAARSASDFVLITDDFSVMIDVLKEGRRVINNIEKVAAIFLLKTVYSVLLTLIYIFIPYPYPIAPLQMMPINELTIGIPSFFLALQANYSRPEGKLLTNILEHTIPAAITVVFNSLYIQTASILFHIPTTESSTMVVFLIGIMGFYQLAKLAKPYTQRIRLLLIGLVCSFVLCFALLGNLFMLSTLFSRNAFFYMPLVYFSYHVHSLLGNICRKAVEAFHILKTAGWLKRSVRE